MHDVTFALAVILGSGFFIGKLGQLARLPSVTGYILAGVILGPSVLNLVSEETITRKLGHFTQIALMLIAFRIGEHLEISRLKRFLKSVGLIGICETKRRLFQKVMLGNFFCGPGIRFAKAAGLNSIKIYSTPYWRSIVATAPASTLHVMRELNSRETLTTTPA